MFQPQIYYNIWDMILPNHASSLSQDSALNRWPRENCYISSYEGPNEISQDVRKRARTVLAVVKISDPEDEPVTHGSSYKFALLNSPEIAHLGKTNISPNWRNQFFSNPWCWKESMRGYLSTKFKTERNNKFGDTIETISGILQKKLKKTRASNIL